MLLLPNTRFIRNGISGKSDKTVATVPYRNRLIEKLFGRFGEGGLSLDGKRHCARNLAVVAGTLDDVSSDVEFLSLGLLQDEVVLST